MEGPAGRDRYSGVNKDSQWSARKAILFRNPTAANLCKCNTHPRRRNARQREPVSSWGQFNACIFNYLHRAPSRKPSSTTPSQEIVCKSDN